MKISKDLALKHLDNPKFCSSQEAIAYAREISDYKVWETVLTREDVAKYLESMTPQELIIFAKEVGSEHLFELVLKRKDVEEYLLE
jgi:hypothetical protein